MNYLTDAPLVLRSSLVLQKANSRQERILNLLAAATIALMGLGIALSPAPAADPAADGSPPSISGD